jgi:uncharacterized protein YciI
MLFALLVEFGPTPPTEELLQRHRDWLFPKFSEGSFILSGGLEAVEDHPPSAIALLEADSLEAAKELLETDPFVRAGACTHRVVPFTARVRVVGMDDRFGADVQAIPVDWHRDKDRPVPRWVTN